MNYLKILQYRYDFILFSYTIKKESVPADYINNSVLLNGVISPIVSQDANLYLSRFYFLFVKTL